MATLTTSPQVIGQNLGNTMNTRLYGWYDGQNGNSCTVHVRLTVTNTGATYTGTNKSYGISVGGYNSGVQSWTYQPLNTNQEYTVAEGSWGYNGGNQISAQGLFWTYNYGSADITSLTSAWYVPTFVSPPTGLSASVAEVYSDGAKLNISISSYGNPSSASGRYIEGAILSSTTYGNPYKYATTSNTTSGQVVVNNSCAGNLSIGANTQYYYGVYANNTQASSSSIISTFVTLPGTFNISSIETTSTTATINYSVDANGGKYDQTLQYSLDGTTWNTFDTITGGSATLGSYTITGLVPSTNYTLKTRVTTTAGTTNNLDATFDTFQGFYGSVNGYSKNIVKLYGSVGGQTKEIKKMYGSVNGQTKLIYKG